MAGTMCAVMVLGLTGCNKDVKAQRDQLLTENQGLRAENLNLNSALEACEYDRNGLVGDLSRAQDDNKQLRGELNSKPVQPQVKPQSTGFDGISGVTGEFRAGEVSARVEGDVLFSSGKVSLKANAKQTLDRIASVLNSTYAGRTIRIEGHTDNDPIKKSSWKTNTRLSAERAMAVQNYLKSKGVDGSRMYVAGFGPNHPLGSKSQSRRVEIVVLLQ